MLADQQTGGRAAGALPRREGDQTRWAVACGGGVRPGIKWPNDLVLNRKKLCGILTELEWEAESGEFSCVIIGAGINVSQDEADFGPEVAPIAISLAQALGTAPDRTELAAQGDPVAECVI